MVRSIFNIFSNRTARHLLFWALWVLGFTVIQSFGKPLHYYFAWFSYYMVTLPLFVVHTYLIAYWLLPVFWKKGRYLSFIFLFLFLYLFFSVIELVVSNEFIFKWFPTGTELLENYLTPGHVLVSGLGNLYIVFVFLAAKSVRDAYLAREEREKYDLIKLEEQYKLTNNRLQPGLLLFSMDQIFDMAIATDTSLFFADAISKI